MSKIGLVLFVLSVPLWALSQVTTEVLTRSTQAVGDQVGAGKTKADFMPQAAGTVQVEATAGNSSVAATLAAGRRQNRRVESIVSGAIIGAAVGDRKP